MQDQTLPPPIELSFNLELADLLASTWEAYSQRRRGEVLKRTSTSPRSPAQRTKDWLKPFIIGFLLGLFHLTFAILVLVAAGNALGYQPPLPPDYYGIFSFGTFVAGVIWFWLLAGPAIARYRHQAACLAEWRVTIPEIFEGPVPVAIHFLAERVSYEMLKNREMVPTGISLRVIDTANYLLLRVRGGMLPLSKKKLPSSAMDAVRRWSAERNALLLPTARRHIYLPRQLSACLGVAVLVSCIWISKHLKLTPQAPIYPTSVTLSLPDTSTIIAGQVVNLERVSYKASENQGTLFDQLSGFVNRPEISGTFDIDRSATPFLAQTAEAEFEQERSWHLAIGQIPAIATMEPLPDSGVFIAWDQPNAADYAGHCGALRANTGTTPVASERVLWRKRLYLQLCTASMSKPELREWMLQAITPINRVLASRTQTNP